MADEVIKNNEIKEILKKYISFKPEEQIQYISEVINSIKDISTSYPEFTENLVLIWNNSYNEVKSEKTIDFILPIFECIDLVQTNIFNNFFEKNFYLNRTISGLFGNTLKEIYGSLDVELQREIFQKMKISFQGSYSALSLLLEVSDVKIKQKEWKSLFEDLMDKSKIAEYIKKLTQREISIKNNDEKINTICLMMFKAFYLDIEEKFKVEICKDVLKKYKEGKISLDFIFEIWDNIPAELQVQNKDILKEIIEKYIDRAGLVLVWRKTCDELQIEYIDIIVKNLDRVNIWNAKTIWENTCEEAQCKNLQPQRTNEKESVNLDLEKASNGVGDVKEKNYLEKFLELCESDWDRKDIWKATKPKAQILCKKYFFNLLANEKYDNEVLSLLKECSQEFLENLAKEEDILKQFKDLFNMDSSSKHDSKFYIVFTYLWKKFSKQQQLDNIDLFLNAIQNQCTNYIVGKDNIWVNASNQDELWDFVFNEFKNNLRILEYVWYNTNQNLQKEKFNQIYETFGTIPACIWKNTNANLQEEWLLELEQAAEGDSERLAEIYSNLKTEIYEKNKERIDNYINENIDDSRIFLYFWYNLSEDLQKDRFVDLWHKVEDDQEKLFEFLRFTKYAIIKEKELEIFSYYKEKKNVFKELIGRLPIPEEKFNEILALCDKDIELEIALFSKLYTGKIINEMFEYLYFRVSEGKDIQTYINFWSAMRYNMQKEKIFVLEDILELSNIKIADVTEIIRNTNEKVLTQEILVKIFNSVIKNDEDRNRVVTKLLFLKELNSGIYKTVNLTFLSNEIVEIFNTEQLLRITADGQLQDRIAENLDNAVFLKILKYVVSNSENLVLELNGICNNLGEYKELLDNLAQNELEEIDLKNIINCISCSKNYFNVKTIDDLKNFTENKKTICQEILESKDILNVMSEDFKKLDSRQQKVFAMLQLVYGIDIEEAENIVKKYGADIDEITPKNEKEENVIKTIQALKIVLK